MEHAVDLEAVALDTYGGMDDDLLVKMLAAFKLDRIGAGLESSAFIDRRIALIERILRSRGVTV